MSEKFIPTHLLRVGKGKQRKYWRVQIIPIGNKDGLNYYNTLLSPRNKSGLHMVLLVPETRLRQIRTKKATVI